MDSQVLHLHFVKQADVQLITQDEQIVGANRSLLAAGSPFFHALFSYGSIPAPSVVCLPSISTAALLPLLDYLHTHTYPPFSFPILLENSALVFHAADFFLIPSLKLLAAHIFCSHALVFKFTFPMMYPELATMFLSDAVDMTWHTGIDMTVTCLVDTVSDCIRSLPLHAVRNLSASALACYLEKTRETSMRFVMRFAESEYARLRCVLLWCACCLDSTEAQDALTVYLPLVGGQTLSFFESSNRPHPLLQKLHDFRDLLSSLFQAWLPYLDLYRVDLDILEDVIKPLGIVPPAYLVKIAHFHALHAEEMLQLRWKQDDANREVISISEDGDMVGSSMGTYVRAKMLVTRSMEWDFVIEETCRGLVLGFCTDDMGMGRSIDEVGYGVHCTGHLFHGRRKLQRYGKRFGRDDTVRVHIDMERHTCRYSISGRAYAVAWENVPNRVYPAIIWFKYPAKVRIEPAFTPDKHRLVEDLQYVAPHQHPFTIPPWRPPPRIT